MGRKTGVEDTRLAAGGTGRPKEGIREDMPMAGLNVLYATQATEEPEWTTIREKDRTKQLREVYWSRRAESHVRPTKFIGAQMKWQCDRGDIDRRSDDPGDGFAYLATVSIEGMELGFHPT